MQEVFFRGLIAVAVILTFEIPHLAQQGSGRRISNRAARGATGSTPKAERPSGGAANAGADSKAVEIKKRPPPLRGISHEKASEANRALGERYLAATRRSDAIEAFRDAVLYMPTNAEAHLGLGRAYYVSGRWQEAAESFRQAVICNPEMTQSHLYLGAAYFNLGRHEKAVEAYGGAATGGPASAHAHYNIANALSKMRRCEPAIRHYKEALHLAPNSAALYNDLGVAYGECGKYKEATRTLEQAVGLDSSDAYAQNNLAVALYLQGRNGEAIIAFEIAARLAPKNSVVNNNSRLALSVLNRNRAAGSPPAVVSTGYAGGESQMIWLDRRDVIHGIAEQRDNTDTAAKPPKDIASTRTEKKEEAPAPPRAEESSAAKETQTAIASVKGAATEDNGEGRVSAPEGGGHESSVDVYRIGEGDVLEIRLLDEDTGKSTLYTVLAGGILDYPVAGGIFKVAGLTSEEVSAHIATELRRRAIDRDPRVLVAVREYASHTVIVTGLVADPGTKVLRREAVPLYVVLADAQPRPEAGRVLVTSRATGRTSGSRLDDQALMKTLIRPGDVIDVLPEQKLYYYIGGSVGGPGQKDFTNGITLTQAILACAGSLQSSATAVITRQSGDGYLSSLTYNLKEIRSGKSADPALQPGDRIEVFR